MVEKMGYFGGKKEEEEGGVVGVVVVVVVEWRRRWRRKWWRDWWRWRVEGWPAKEGAWLRLGAAVCWK